MKILFVLVLLFGFLRVAPARADFGLTASIVGLVVGVGLVVVPPFLDKKNQDEEVFLDKIEDKEAGKSGVVLKDESEKEDKKVSLDLSRAALEDSRFKAVGRGISE